MAVTKNSRYLWKYASTHWSEDVNNAHLLREDERWETGPKLYDAIGKCDFLGFIETNKLRYTANLAWLPRIWSSLPTTEEQISSNSSRDAHSAFRHSDFRNDSA